MAKIRRRIAILLLFIIPAGFLFKFYPGPGNDWFNNYGAAILYEVFWILLLFFILPKKGLINRIPIWVFVVTCALEFLQLWQPLFLQAIRSVFIGRALIGATFSVWDFPHYLIGCVIGWLLLKSLKL